MEIQGLMRDAGEVNLRSRRVNGSKVNPSYKRLYMKGRIPGPSSE